MSEPPYLIARSELPRLIYAYININDPATRQTILDFTEDAASARLHLGNSESECSVCSGHDTTNDQGADETADKKSASTYTGPHSGLIL